MSEQYRNRIIETRLMRIGDIAPHPFNPRTHPQSQIDPLRGHLEETGKTRIPTVYRSERNNGALTFTDGHGRQAINPDELWTIAITDLTDAEADLDLAIGDPLAALAGTDSAKLEALLSEVSSGEAAVQQMLAGLAEQVGIGLEVEVGQGGDDFDTTPDDGPTRTALGQLWQIGPHRLIVGDCTDPDVVARLMDGEELNLIVTDPPYGVSYADKNAYLNAVGRGNRIQVPIVNDHGTIEETAKNLWEPAFATMYSAAMRGCSLYCFMPQGGDQMMMMMMMMSSKWPPRHELIWLKNNHVLGRADYAYKHEPIVYAWKDAGHTFYGGFQVSVLEFDRPQKSDLHPTTKPLALIEHLIHNSSASGDLVGDWFLGSGTTLIAAHRTNRRCYGCEISEKYADVILRRAEAEGLTCELADELPHEGERTP